MQRSRLHPAWMVLMLLPGMVVAENPWKERVPRAVEQAERALVRALDTAFRADDWQTGAQLADAAVLFGKRSPELRARIARAYWRAGRLPEAEWHADLLDPQSNDRVALRVLTDLHLARGSRDTARALAERLGGQPSAAPEDLYRLFQARTAAQQFEGAPQLLQRIERLASSRNGYPEMYLAESVTGVSTFLTRIGPEPLNQVRRYGSAPMPPLVLIGLPACDVVINGQGPYRMILDTGGSIMIALDQAIADDLGLKSIAPASVRGVSGKQTTGQVLLERVEIGGVELERVLCRTFDVRSALMNLADGIVGTGIFGDARLTLDFAEATFEVSASSGSPAPGAAVDVRIVGDAKLMVPVVFGDAPAVALLDTGADAIAISPSRQALLFTEEELQTFEFEMPLGVGSGHATKLSMSPGAPLEFAGRRFEGYGGLGLSLLDEILGPVLGMQTDVLIGMPTFRLMSKCTIDYPTARLWIEWLPE